MNRAASSSFSRVLRIALWFIVAPSAVIAAAVIAAAIVIALRRPPERIAPRPAVPRVEALRAVEQPVRLSVSGYGEARSARRTELSAEVGGGVVWVSPLLREGGRTPEGAELVKLDTTDFELAYRRAKAELDLARSSLERLQSEQENQRRLLAIQQDELALAERDLARIEGLLRDGAASRQEVDAALQGVLRQRAAIRTIENQLALLPIQIQEQQARIDLALTRVDETDIHLARTVVRAPFDAIVVAQNVDLGQNLQPRVPFATLIDPSDIEIPVDLPLGDLDALFGGGDPQPADFGDIGVEVRFRAGNGRLTAWEGRIVRIRPVDPRTRTVPVVAGVPRPGEPIEGHRRRTLEENLFCEVVFSGRRLPGAIVIPRDALRADGHVWVARPSRLAVWAFGSRLLDAPLDEGQHLSAGVMLDGGDTLSVLPTHRLAIRAVGIGHRMGHDVVVTSGLRPGELAITSPLRYPVEGMTLRVERALRPEDRP